MISAKDMIPPMLNPTSSGGTEWRDWNYRVKNYAGRLIDQALKVILGQVILTRKKIGYEDFALLSMTKEWDELLRDFLTQRTGGEAYDIIRAGEDAPEIDIWRQLAVPTSSTKSGRLTTRTC